MKLYKRIWNWYFKLPWWGKIIGSLSLVLILILFILSFFNVRHRPNTEHIQKLDEVHERSTTKKLKTLENNLARKKELFKQKRKTVAIKINQANYTDVERLENRKRIREATSMEQLDALQKELGL